MRMVRFAFVCRRQMGVFVEFMRKNMKYEELVIHCPSSNKHVVVPYLVTIQIRRHMFFNYDTNNVAEFLQAMDT